MKPQDLAEECLRALTQQPGAPFIVVRGRLPQKGWPRGKCVGSDSRGRFYMYDAAKLLIRLWALRVCTVESLVLADGSVEIRVNTNGKTTILPKEISNKFHKE